MHLSPSYKKFHLMSNISLHFICCYWFQGNCHRNLSFVLYPSFKINPAAKFKIFSLDPTSSILQVLFQISKQQTRAVNQAWSSKVHLNRIQIFSVLALNKRNIPNTSAKLGKYHMKTHLKKIVSNLQERICCYRKFVDRQKSKFNRDS